MEREQKVIIRGSGGKKTSIIKEIFDNLEVIKAKYAVKSGLGLLPNQFELEEKKEGIYDLRILDRKKSKENFNKFLYESKFMRLDIPKTKDSQIMSTDISRSSVRLIVKFVIPPEQSLLDIFNNFVTNKKYPCIQYRNNFKFVPDFQIGEVIVTDGLAIYSEHPSHTAKTIEKYDRITIDPESKFTDQEYTNLFRMDFNAEIKENEQEEAKNLLQKLTGLENIPTAPEIEEEKDEYEESVQQLLGLNIEKGERQLTLAVPLDTPLHITSMGYSDIFATFYIPIEEISIEFYILQDLILNDDDFSMIAVDERMRAGRERDTLYLYMKNGNVRCNLSIGNTDTEATVRKELTKIGSRSKKYLRIRVTRITELEDLERLRIVIERMLGIYLQKYEEVQDDYSNYMVIEPIAHKKGRERKARRAGVKMKEADPVAQELFGEETYYSSVCARPQQPDILELPEGYYKQGDQKQKNKYEIVFPIPPYRDKQYLFDCSKGEKQIEEGEEEWKEERKVLITNPKRDKGKLYAGLKKNTSAKAKFELSQRHPYVPCCFNKPLKLRTNPSNIRNITHEYFQGKYGFGAPPKEEKDEVRKQPRLQTMKILKEGQAGDAPSSVTDLIYKIDVERKGFDGTLFGCVKEALFIEDEDDIIDQIEDEIDQVSYLEDKYGVNIWIFSNQEAFKMGGRARIGKLVDTKQGVSFELYDRNIVVFHNYGGAFQKTQEKDNKEKGGKYELIQSRKGKNRIRVFDNETVFPLIYVFNGLYPYKIIKKLQNVTGQYKSILEINGGRYAVPERIPRYAVRTLEFCAKRKTENAQCAFEVNKKNAGAIREGISPPGAANWVTYYGVQDTDFYNQYTIKQRKIYTILEYAKYAFSNFLKDMFQLAPRDSYQETMVKLEEFHKEQEEYFSLFQKEKCEEQKQLPDFDYTSMSSVDNPVRWSPAANGKFIYSSNEFLARVMFYIRQQLFIDEISLVTYYKRKTFGIGPIPYIKPPSMNERLIRSYPAMELLTKVGGNNFVGIRELRDTENLQTQFVSFRGKTYSLVRADNIDDALGFSEKVGLKISSYDLLSYNENGELEENIEGQQAGDTLVFRKFDKFFSVIPYPI
jgi:hypothetical protein